MNNRLLTSATKETKYDEKRRQLYFFKQKMIGVFLLGLTLITVKLLEGDATVALLTVPLGLILIFTKKKYLINEYYLDDLDWRRS